MDLVAVQFVLLAQRVGEGQQRVPMFEDCARGTVGGPVHEVVGPRPCGLVVQDLRDKVARAGQLRRFEAIPFALTR